MSIKDRQQVMALEEILQDYLSTGRYPEAVEIQQRLVEAFQERPAGLPRFNPTLVESDKLSNPEDYNRDMTNIAKDLETSFFETNYQANRLLGIMGSYETEKEKVLLALRKLEDRIETVKLKLAPPTSKIVLSDTLQLFSQIDFKGNKERGIPKTSALVDLRYGQVLLENVSVGGTKYDISDSNHLVKLTKGSGQGNEHLEFSNILRDSLNEAWEYRVTSNTIETTEVTAVIELREIVEATGVSLQLHSPKRTAIKLEVADENEVFREMTVHEGMDLVEWKFNERVKFIRMTFIKNEPDYSHETEHEYQFGATNFSIKKEAYLPQGYFVSEPFEVKNKIVNKISLTTRDVLFPKTNIRYYIGVDDNAKMVEWQEIEPGRTIELNELMKRDDTIAKSYSGYGTKVHENFGVDFYQLGILPYVPEEKSMKLYMGSYMWQVDTVSSNKSEGYQPNLSDWLNPKNVNTMFYPIEKTLGAESMQLTENTLQRMTTYVYCDDEAQVLNNRLAIDPTTKAAVYINNTLIKPIVNTSGHLLYNYRFQKGWNTIQILTHSTATGAFKANLYLKDIASRIYAIKEGLVEVSLYDLYNNVSKKDYTKFALDGNKIIVNYNPLTLDSSNNGVTYYAEYKYAPANIPTDTNIRFMAILSRSETDDKVSPILKNYQLIIE